jgi:Bacterial Ig domain
MSNSKPHISDWTGLILAVSLVVGCWLVLAGPAWAQDSGLRLSLSKDWGFSAGGQVQGLFTLSASGPQDMASVQFELDGAEIAAVTQSPFKWQFNTDQYPVGGHALSAAGRMPDGSILRSNTIRVEFVSAETGWQVTQRIMLPIFAVVAVILILSTAGQLVLGRDRRRPEPGAPRQYGPAGGAICPKCGRPFALSFFSLHLITRRLERCPYCGKWSWVARATPEALAAAEAAETEASRPAVPETSLEDKLRQQIEESRYQ